MNLQFVLKLVMNTKKLVHLCQSNRICSAFQGYFSENGTDGRQ